MNKKVLVIYFNEEKMEITEKIEEIHKDEYNDELVYTSNGACMCVVEGKSKDETKLRLLRLLYAETSKERRKVEIEYNRLLREEESVRNLLCDFR